MNPSHSQQSFVLGGPVKTSSPFYVTRNHFEEQVLRETLNKNYVSIIGSRQVGKTSMLQRIQQVMESSYDYAAALIDMSTFNEPNIEFRYWANEFCDRLIDQLQPYLLEGTLPNIPDVPTGFRRYFQVLAELISRPRILVLIDEASAIPSDIGDPVYSIIRWIYTNRTETRPVLPLQKYNFAFAGVFEPEKLVKDRNNSPFNVSHVVRVPDFNRSEIRQLVRNIGAGFTTESQSYVVDAIYDWTHGHPFLTHCYCSLVDGVIKSNGLPSITYETIYGLGTQLTNLASNNIDHVVKLSLDSEDTSKIIQQLLGGAKIPFSRGRSSIARLELIGTLLEDGSGFCRFRNPLYETAVRRAASEILPKTEKHNFDRTRLREILATKFNESELKVLCSDLGIDYQYLEGTQINQKALELVTYMERRDELEQLVDAIRRARPRAQLSDD